MNKIKIDNYYKPESKTLRLDEIDYTIIPNSDIKPLLDKLQQENEKLKIQISAREEEYKKLEDNWNKLKEIIKKKFIAQGGFTSYEWNDLLNDLLDKMQELENGDSNEI